MPSLVEQLVAIHDAQDRHGIPHAFGGAIALGYCTEEPRGTRDIDVNVFVDVAEADSVLAALPDGVAIHDVAADHLRRDGQVRVKWDGTPIDLFLDVADFHHEAAARTRSVPFSGVEIPILDCTTLAVFKAMFSRNKDWVDIQTMAEAGTLDATYALGWLTRLLGAEHDAVVRLAAVFSSS